ncbi:hypothetical protein [Rubrivirga sp. IMCC43871]|uniref:hypothetical protein n=1 Tax=Rubrivirga sp. IMCC43871 TaxID=3391575 RepID=UPI00398FB9CC
MTDPPSPPDPTPPASPPRRWDWRPTLRWFAAEIVVVVAGVLIALALNAWWGSRQDAARERAYLRGVLAELQATEAELMGEIATSRDLFGDAQRVHQAYFLASPPPVDSLQAWWRFSHSDPEPTFGTLRALIGTGDLTLIRDDSVRAALVWIGERAGYYDVRLRRWEEKVLASLDVLAPMTFAQKTARWAERGRPPADLDGSGTWGDAVRSLPAETRRPPFVVSPAALLDDPVLYGAVVAYLVAARNHLRNQERLLADVRTARQRIEATSELAHPRP